MRRPAAICKADVVIRSVEVPLERARARLAEKAVTDGLTRRDAGELLGWSPLMPRSGRRVYADEYEVDTFERPVRVRGGLFLDRAVEGVITIRNLYAAPTRKPQGGARR